MGLLHKKILKRKLVRHRHAGGKIAGFRTVEPLEYYIRFLKENSHPDGRELGELGTTIVNMSSVSTADGSVSVKLENTTEIFSICSTTNRCP